MTFNVKSDKNIPAEQLKKKVRNALLDDINYPVLDIETHASPSNDFDETPVGPARKAVNDFDE